MKGLSKPDRGFDSFAIAQGIAKAIQRDLSTLNHVKSVDPRYNDVLGDAYEKNLLKKFSKEDPKSRDKLEANAFAAFRQEMSSMRRTNDFLVRLRGQPDIDPALYKLVERARTLSRKILGRLSYEEWFASCKTSNGSTVGVPYSDTSLERKFEFPISSSGSVISIFGDYLEWDNNLAEALFWANFSKPTKLFSIVECSRATTVPKQVDKRRMIAVEPTLNMFFQQGLMGVMYSRLRDFGLDVTSLPKRHQTLAMCASISGTCSTVDFSSASDCVSIELARWILPPEWFEACWLVRTPNIRLKDQIMELPIMSTMGNATTFPIETVIFYSLAVASVMQMQPHNPRYGRGNPGRILSNHFEESSCSVFGDDCILPTYAYETFSNGCEKLGFKVNKDKSFSTGGFRESCGGDYYHGRDVRPLYIRAPQSERLSALAPWLYGILNRIQTKYVMYFGSVSYIYDKEVFRYIFSVFQEYKLLVRFVPDYMPDDAGLRISEAFRWLRHYNFAISPHRSSLVSGSMRFTYYSFQYKRKRSKDPNLRYWQSLRELEKRSDLLHPLLDHGSGKTYDIRRIGGYLVVSGLSSHVSGTR